MFLVNAQRGDSRSPTVPRIEDLVNLTAGQLAGRLRLPTLILDEIRDLVRLRNRLAHQFLWRQVAAIVGSGRDSESGTTSAGEALISTASASNTTAGSLARDGSWQSTAAHRTTSMGGTVEATDSHDPRSRIPRCSRSALCTIALLARAP